MIASREKDIRVATNPAVNVKSEGVILFAFNPAKEITAAETKASAVRAAMKTAGILESSGIKE